MYNPKTLETEKSSPIDSSVSIKDGSARWTMPSVSLEKGELNLDKNQAKENNNNIQPSKTEPTLRSINIDLPKGKLIGVIGPVGAGKSSLLQVILRELPLEHGSLSVNGSISYACQETWVFPGSVRQNILFGQQYERDRYDMVVKMCALVKDFEQFENGDLTIVGERGQSLSGGQKARLK